MWIVVAMVLTLLGVLGVCGFFHLRGMVRDAEEEQANATEAILAALQGNKEAIESLKATAVGARLQVLALGAQIGDLTALVEAHIDEAMVGPVSIRGMDVPAALAAGTAPAPPPRSGRQAGPAAAPEAPGRPRRGTVGTGC